MKTLRNGDNISQLSARSKDGTKRILVIVMNLIPKPQEYQH